MKGNQTVERQVLEKGQDSKRVKESELSQCNKCKGRGIKHAGGKLNPHLQMDNFLDRCKNWQDATHPRAWDLLVEYALDEDKAFANPDSSPAREATPQDNLVD